MKLVNCFNDDTFIANLDAHNISTCFFMVDIEDRYKFFSLLLEDSETSEEVKQWLTDNIHEADISMLKTTPDWQHEYSIIDRKVIKTVNILISLNYALLKNYKEVADYKIVDGKVFDTPIDNITLSIDDLNVPDRLTACLFGKDFIYCEFADVVTIDIHNMTDDDFQIECVNFLNMFIKVLAAGLF